MLLAATEAAPPVGGASFTEIAVAAAMALAVNVPVAWFVLREITGHQTLIGRFADWVAAKEGTPRWVALPRYALIFCLLTAGFGVWWDVPIHMQNGRDEGPLANPSHYPIYFALLGILATGILSAALAHGQPLPRRSFKIAGDWRAPMGSMIIIAAGLIALAGFPLDDLWHRIFGQDVTEWGPTHTMMIGGAVTCVLALPLLHEEAAQLSSHGAQGFWGKFRGTIAIGVCIVPFAFLMEFDLGVPQFPAATQFIIAGFLTGWIFVAARRYFGPGGALIAWAVYILAHLFLLATVALTPNTIAAKFLLFLPAALIVEAVALAIKPRRGYVFGAVAGVLVGSVGMFAEWLWSRIFMPLPQPLPSSALPLMLTVGTLAGLGGGLLGGWFHDQLARVSGAYDDTVTYDAIEAQLRRARIDRLPFGEWLVGTFGPRVFDIWHTEMLQRTGPTSSAPARRVERHGLGLVGGLLLLALMAMFAPPRSEEGINGVVELSRNCPGGPELCMTDVTVTMQPVDAADDAVWLYALGYQGNREAVETGAGGDVPGDGVLRVRMLPTGMPGQFRAEEPLPAYGHWKTLIRLHRAPGTHVALAIHAPDDPAITEPKGRQILAKSGETHPFVYEPTFLQRERADGVPRWLWTLAYGVVLAAWLVTIGFYAWAYGQAAYGGTAQPVPSRPREPAPVG